jgi:hypothetical protein
MSGRTKTKVKFLFEPGVQQRSFYIKKTRSSVEKLSELFPISPPSITVHIFQNRVAFLSAIRKKKAPEWFIAYVPPKNTSHIYILSNKEKPMEKKMISQLLLHEITHLYTNTLNPSLPDWLKEGISVYVAEQIFNPLISAADWKKIVHKGIPFRHVPWKLAVEHNGYSIAGLLILFFVRQYGWEKFIASIDSRRQGSFSKNTMFYPPEKFKQLIKDFKKQFVK